MGLGNISKVLTSPITLTTTQKAKPLNPMPSVHIDALEALQDLPVIASGQYLTILDDSLCDSLFLPMAL